MSNELPCEPFGISHTHSFHLPPHNANLSVPISSRLSCAYISLEALEALEASIAIGAERVANSRA